MSKRSECVKEWRRRTKNRIIESMGGACCICGYNKCPATLALHHLDPSKKDISFGNLRANAKRWSLIVKELRKCILVCHNCHSEIHANFILVPDNYPKFDEKFSDYKLLEIVEEDFLTPCPICGTLKKAQLKNCSYQCAAKSKYRVDWDNVDLVKELKTKSILALADELGCSDAAIHKRLKKLELK